MRIAFVLPYDFARAGGVRTHTLALAGWLRRHGHDAQIIAPSSALSASRASWQHVVGRPRPLRIGQTVGSVTPSLQAVRRTRALLEADWDIVHIQEPFVPLLGPAALRSTVGRTSTVLTFHSAEAAARRWYRRLAPVLRRHLSSVDALIAVSAASLETVGSALPGPAALIPPCIDAFPIVNAPSGVSGPAALLFIGRDEPRKGLRVLLRAFALLSDREAVLHIVGPLRPSTEQLIGRLGLRGRIHLHGQLNAGGVRRLLGEVSMLCAPATGGEALGLVLVEAMVAGVPVLASDIDGYRIPARSGRAALLAPPGDAPALAAAIDRVLADSQLRSRLAAGGRASARRFTAAVVAPAHLALYQRLLTRR